MRRLLCLVLLVLATQAMDAQLAIRLLLRTSTAAPDAFVYDTFTEIADVALGTHIPERGGPWSCVNGGMVITDANRVRQNTEALAYCRAAATPPSAIYNVEARIYFATLITGQSPGFCGRCSGATLSVANGYFVQYDVAEGRWYFNRVDNGAFTNLDTFDATYSATDTVTVRLELGNSTKRVWIAVNAGASVERMSSTDNSIGSVGAVGLYLFANSSNTTGAHVDSIIAWPFTEGTGGGGGSGEEFLGYRAHWQGFGANTEGAWGHPSTAPYTCRVTTLTENTALSAPAGDGSRTGSLDRCLEDTAPRVIVFETSGIAIIDDNITITSPYFTVAGQTAPSPGVTVWTRRGIYPRATGGVIQHLRFVGAGLSGSVGSLIDAGDIIASQSYVNLWVQGDGANICFDHVSSIWASYLNFDIGKPGPFPGVHPTNVCVFDSIFAESMLDYRGNALIFHSGGNRVQATMARNLFAVNSHRNPVVQAGYYFQDINNVVYGSGRNQFGDTTPFSWSNVFFAAYEQSNGGGGWCDDGPSIGDPDNVIEAVRLNTVSIAGPDTDPASYGLILVGVTGALKVYVSGNTGLRGTDAADIIASNPDGKNCDTVVANHLVGSPFAWHTAMNWTPIPTASTEAFVLANAGARPLDRHPDDTAIVNETAARTGVAVSSFTLANMAANTRTYTLPANPNDPGTCGGTHTIQQCQLEHDTTFGARRLEPQFQ